MAANSVVARPTSGLIVAGVCLVAAVAAVLAQSASRAASSDAPRPYTTWNSYLGGAHSAQFTALDQINTSNVSRLTVAWTFPAGNRTFLFNPLVADGLAFVLAISSRSMQSRGRRSGRARIPALSARVE